MFTRRLVSALVALWLAATAGAASVVVLDGADVLPVSGPRIEKGRIVIRDGKLVAVGPADAVPIPEGAEVRELAGRLLIPGLVDTHSHIGVYPKPGIPAHEDGNEISAPLQSGVRALDSLWPGDPGIRMARAGGVTTANVMPGSGTAVGGQTAYVKLRGANVEEMLVGGALGGIKMAGGENPKRVFGERGQAPSTRMGVAALQRGLLVQAQEYRAKLAKKDPEPVPRNLDLEPMVEVLEGRRTVHYHSHRADDIATALRLQEEFGFDLVIQHGTEAHLVADELARRGIPVSTIVIETPGGKPEVVGLALENPGLLERAGVRVAIHSDDPITDSRLLLRSAALAVRGGMSEEGALRAVTLEAARILQLEKRVGSLEPGKDADLLVLSGPPFSVYTQVLETWIDGVRVFDRKDPRDRSYAVGGFAVEGAPR